MLVTVRCDATQARGVGHVARQMALVEELLERGHDVVIAGDMEVAWAKRLTAGLPVVPAMGEDDFAHWCVGKGVDIVVIDGYDFGPRLGQTLRAARIPVAAMADGPFGADQVADLFIDQNLGAEPPAAATVPWLAGARYTLLRDVVLRRAMLPRPSPNGPPRVLVVFGGTDPFGGGPVAAGLLLDTGMPVRVTAVAADPRRAAEVEALRPGAGQDVEVVGAQDDLPALAQACDAAVSAAGSTVWELACLGVPTALVCVTGNQRVGYDIAARDLCLGVGYLDELRTDGAARCAAVEALRGFLGDEPGRLEMGKRARGVIDGAGRKRVADALENLARDSHV